MISHCSKVLHLSPTLGPTLTLGERTKYLCAFPVRSHKVGSHSYRNGYHDSYQMSIRTTQQRSVFFPVFKECSGLRNLIYPHAILFQKFKKGKKVAVNNQELRSRRKLHWKQDSVQISKENTITDILEILQRRRQQNSEVLLTGILS